MSRIGKVPISIPSQVKVELSGQQISVVGLKGSLSRVLHKKVKVDINAGENIINVLPFDKDNLSKSIHGLTRTLISNMIVGVSEGYTKTLEIIGVGYKVQILPNNSISLSLGYSTDFIYVLPEDVQAAAPKPTTLVLSSINKESLGSAAAQIRSLRPPEPYKGKGIKYSDEKIRRKEGKRKAK